MILTVILFFSWVVIIPETMYILNAWDYYYFGYFNEMGPQLASTTNQKIYFQRHDIPYYLYDDLKANRIME